MTTEAALETLRQYGRTPATAQFWMSSTPARNFASLSECLVFLADARQDEPMPDVRVHADHGDIAINGPELEELIAAARTPRPVG